MVIVRYGVLLLSIDSSEEFKRQLFWIMKNKMRKGNLVKNADWASKCTYNRINKLTNAKSVWLLCSETKVQLKIITFMSPDSSRAVGHNAMKKFTLFLHRLSENSTCALWCFNRSARCFKNSHYLFVFNRRLLVTVYATPLLYDFKHVSIESFCLFLNNFWEHGL